MLLNLMKDISMLVLLSIYVGHIPEKSIVCSGQCLE